MTAEDHADLLEVLASCRGKVMLSGYPSGLYDSRLKGWARHDFDMPNHAAGGGGINKKLKARMTECLWCNFPAPA
jgi:DNA adenine methylase